FGYTIAHAPADALGLSRASVDLVALAELELEGGLLELVRTHAPARRRHALEGGQPGVVVAERAAAGLGGGDLRDQRLAELLPRQQASLRKRDRHAEHTALPRLVEDQFAVAARHRRPAEARQQAVKSRCGGILCFTRRRGGAGRGRPLSAQGW